MSTGEIVQPGTNYDEQYCQQYLHGSITNCIVVLLCARIARML